MVNVYGQIEKNWGSVLTQREVRMKFQTDCKRNAALPVFP